MNTWFPQFKAFWAAENIIGTIHNIYTLRGALVRDALAWSKHINVALYRYGQTAEYMFASHSWPRFGNARIQEVMRIQRDTYAHLHNYVLHLANQGVTINEIHNLYKLPDSLRKHWAAHSYHGSEEHNSRAVINRYLGYWDANPANLIPLSPRESAPLYVEMMGGANKIMAKAQQLHDQGRYREAVEILNKLVYAEPDNQAARACWRTCTSSWDISRKTPVCATVSWRRRLSCVTACPLEPPNPSTGHDPSHVNGTLAQRPGHQHGLRRSGMQYVINLVTRQP